jgi:hypothetical protein
LSKSHSWIVKDPGRSVPVRHNDMNGIGPNDTPCVRFATNRMSRDSILRAPLR